jgi:hypothetical protein
LGEQGRCGGDEGGKNEEAESHGGGPLEGWNGTGP